MYVRVSFILQLLYPWGKKEMLKRRLCGLQSWSGHTAEEKNPFNRELNLIIHLIA